jgi:hypothetical protein
MPRVTGTVTGKDGQPLNGVTVRLARADTGAALGSAVTGSGGASGFAVSHLHLPLETDAVDVSPSNLGAFTNMNNVTFDGTKATFSGSNYLQKTGLSGLPVIGTGDFTFDFTFGSPVGANTGLRVLFDDASAQFYFDFQNDTTGRVGLAGAVALTSTIAIVKGQEHYVRVKRQAGVLTMHFDGVQVGSTASAHNVPAFTSVHVGSYAGGQHRAFSGETLRHVRLVVGEALAGGGQMAPLPTSEPPPAAPGLFSIVTAYTDECHEVIQSPYADRNHLVFKVTPGGA